MKFVSDLRQFGGFIRVLPFPPSKYLPPWYSWNIVESGVKYHNPKPLKLRQERFDENGKPITKCNGKYWLQLNVHIPIGNYSICRRSLKYKTDERTCLHKTTQYYLQCTSIYWNIYLTVKRCIDKINPSDNL
jgi:hypothetical protein